MSFIFAYSYVLFLSRNLERGELSEHGARGVAQPLLVHTAIDLSPQTQTQIEPNLTKLCTITKQEVVF